VDKFIIDSAGKGLSEITQRKMLAICYSKVKDLDDSGRGKRSIEWRKRALEFSGADDQKVWMVYICVRGDRASICMPSRTNRVY